MKARGGRSEEMGRERVAISSCRALSSPEQLSRTNREGEEHKRMDLPVSVATTEALSALV